MTKKRELLLETSEVLSQNGTQPVGFDVKAPSCTETGLLVSSKTRAGEGGWTAQSAGVGEKSVRFNIYSGDSVD